MSIVGLITARGGSKGIPGKNIIRCAGKPLLQYSCEAALRSRLDRVILSTDDAAIADVGRACGVEVPFMRPATLSADDTTSIAVMRHALEWLRSEASEPEAMMLLQPTSPLRTNRHVDESILLFRERAADTVVSVVEVPHRFHPLSIMREHSGELHAFEGDRITVTRRQDLTPLFARNGPAVLLVTPAQLDAGHFYGGRVVGYPMNALDSIDIDTIEDLQLAEYFLLRRSH